MRFCELVYTQFDSLTNHDELLVSAKPKPPEAAFYLNMKSSRSGNFPSLILHRTTASNTRRP